MPQVHPDGAPVEKTPTELAQPQHDSSQREQSEPDTANAAWEILEYRENACFCIKREWCIRRVLTLLVRNVWFERLSLTMIGLNCVTLALYNPKDTDCETKKCQVLETLEMSFTLFFAVEMTCKMVAMGVYGDNSYLSTGWNRLDCVIVLFGLVDLLPFDSISGVTALRALRALRPLRTINKLPGLRILITLLLETLPMMGNVCLLALFLITVFAIIGIQMWGGVYRQRCENLSTGLSYDPDGFGLANSYVCSTEDQAGWLRCAAAVAAACIDRGRVDSCTPTDIYGNALANYSSYTHCGTVTGLLSHLSEY